MRGIAVGLDLGIEMVGQLGDRVRVLRSEGQVAVDDLAGGTQERLVAAAVEVRLQGGIEIDRPGGFAGLGSLPRHDTWSRLGDARALFRVVMRASPLQQSGRVR
jgi:hypothetical protein